MANAIARAFLVFSSKKRFSEGVPFSFMTIDDTEQCVTRTTHCLTMDSLL